MSRFIKASKSDDGSGLRMPERVLVMALVILFIFPFDYLTLSAKESSAVMVREEETETGILPVPVDKSSSETLQDIKNPQNPKKTIPNDSTQMVEAELLVKAESDSIPPTEVVADDYPYGLDGKKVFNPSPKRAVWMSALCPGLGQIYNRRYWKLPIVVGGFMGLGYATNWNSNQYQDYVQGYRDLTDNDPNTKSYLDFFPPTVNESELDQEWLKRTFKSRRDYFRRNRDLCIICLVALYLVCMVDAYIDASMAHFDISPDLSLDMSPVLLNQPASRKPALGINWAFTF